MKLNQIEYIVICDFSKTPAVNKSKIIFRLVVFSSRLVNVVAYTYSYRRLSFSNKIRISDSKIIP